MLVDLVPFRMSVGTATGTSARDYVKLSSLLASLRKIDSATVILTASSLTLYRPR